MGQLKCLHGQLRYIKSKNEVTIPNKDRKDQLRKTIKGTQKILRGRQVRTQMGKVR